MVDTQIENQIWIEKYRPKTLNDFVGNEDFKEKIKIGLEKQDIPSLLLYGPPGCGKTTVSKIIENELDCQCLFLNISDENSVEVVRDKIKTFVSSVGFNKWKLVVGDEFDFATPNFQAALRNIIESFSTSARFILTCNYIEKVIDPIKSRCQTYELVPPSKKDVAKKLQQILKSENVEFEVNDIVTLVSTYFPDIRKVVNSAQQYTINGQLRLSKQSLIDSDYVNKVIEELKNEKDKKKCFESLRKIIADSKVKDFEPLFRGLYDRLSEYANGKIASVILSIAETQRDITSVVDKEIQIAALFIKILNEINS